MYLTTNKTMGYIHLFIVLLVLSVNFETAFVIACPTECSCRGATVKCKPGQTTIPAELDATYKLLSISGLATQPNTIPTLSKTMFQSASNIEVMIISFSQVETIESGAFSGLTKLRDLSLADNDLTTLKADRFSGLTTLRTLDISGNQNCRFDTTLFTHLRTLEELNLGNMNIDKLDTDIFNMLSNLKVLKLYANNIVKLNSDIFLPLTKLESLDLTGNQLLGLEIDLKPLFSRLRTVHLGENPWQCNCQIPWLLDLPSAFTYNQTDNAEVICNGPQRLKYTSLMHVPDDDFKCIPPKVVRCESTTYTLDVNKGLVISCEFEGDPDPYVKWIQPGGKIFDKVGTTQGAYTLHYNGTLAISGVTAPDDGQWTVVAYNATANDEMKIDVNVIITTTSTSTTTSMTTRPPPGVPTKAPGHTSKTTARVQSQASKVASTLSPGGSTVAPSVLPESSKSPVASESDKGGSLSGVNIGLLIAAAGGGTLVGLCILTVMCCKIKQNHEKSQIEPLSEYGP